MSAFKLSIPDLIISFATSNSIPLRSFFTSSENSIFTRGEFLLSDLLRTITPSDTSTNSKYLDII